MVLAFLWGGYFDMNLAKQFPALVLFGNKSKHVLLSKIPSNLRGRIDDRLLRSRKKSSTPCVLGKLQERLRILILRGFVFQDDGIDHDLGLPGERQNFRALVMAGVVPPVANNNQRFPL